MLSNPTPLNIESPASMPGFVISYEIETIEIVQDLISMDPFTFQLEPLAAYSTGAEGTEHGNLPRLAKKSAGNQMFSFFDAASLRSAS